MSEMSSSTDPHSFTVSYLQSSCGLSQESAILASKNLCIETPEKADSFLKLLRAHGLTETHVKMIIATCPSLLLADLEDKIRPNLELFESLGISGNSVGKMLSKQPRVLERKAHEFVEFFRARGFSDEQIIAMAMKCPSLFLLSASKNLKPKLDLLKSIGLQDEGVARVLSSMPYILQRSLENKIVPCIQVLRRVLGSDTDVLKVMKFCHFIVDHNLEKVLEPNMSMLKSQGVPEHLILRIFMIQPRTLLISLDRLTEILADVVKFGFDPKTMHFVLAVRAMAVMSKAQWEQKLEAYKSSGLSIDQIYSAFKLQPHFMLVSEKKIKKSMNFLMNKLNMEISAIYKCPNLLLLSLEKRFIPRCSVLQLLMSKGLLKEKMSIHTYLQMSEKRFVEKTVMKYRQELPDVVKAYEGKIEFQGYPAILKLRP